MRAVAIAPDSYKTFPDLLEGMHRLRARVFRDRLNWDVDVRDEREADSFDDCRPTYILAITDRNAVVGCARLLPATGPTLLSVLFPELRERGLIKPHVAMIESSRFCVDTSLEAGGGGEALHEATRTTFPPLIGRSMADGYSELITATDVRIERILRRAGWPMSRIGEPKKLGNTDAVVGLLPTDLASFERVRPATYVSTIAPLRRAA